MYKVHKKWWVKIVDKHLTQAAGTGCVMGKLGGKTAILQQFLHIPTFQAPLIFTHILRRKRGCEFIANEYGVCLTFPTFMILSTAPLTPPSHGITSNTTNSLILIITNAGNNDYIVKLHNGEIIHIPTLHIEDNTYMCIDGVEPFTPLPRWIHDKSKVTFKHEDSKFYKGVLLHTDERKKYIFKRRNVKLI